MPPSLGIATKDADLDVDMDHMFTLSEAGDISRCPPEAECEEPGEAHGSP